VPSATEREPAIESLTVDLAPHTLSVRAIARTLHTDEGPSLDDADVIVAGGIGLGSAEGFDLAEQLAGALGGAVAATRAAVYKGWYPASAQVGQTGKTVSPKLYVALGISGAVQHKVGMQNSKTIIAINKDPHAPIFEFSDLAVIGDVHAVVPELVELLRKHTG
jgi:electron transfer flavoprotein alpha subunit